jgi:hypothetical protein
VHDDPSRPAFQCIDDGSSCTMTAEPHQYVSPTPPTPHHTAHASEPRCGWWSSCFNQTTDRCSLKTEAPHSAAPAAEGPRLGVIGLNEARCAIRAAYRGAASAHCSWSLCCALRGPLTSAIVRRADDPASLRCMKASCKWNIVTPDGVDALICHDDGLRRNPKHPELEQPAA